MRLPLRVSALVLTAAGVSFFAFRARRLPTKAIFTPFSAVATTTTATTATAAATANIMAPRGAVIALSHGGGPLPVLGDPASKALADSLRKRVPAILGLEDPQRRPRAIVLVTAHWSTSEPAISSAEKHRLYYDYGGFPAEAYRLQYGAPGSPEVARRVAEVLSAEDTTYAGSLTGHFQPRLDPERGWDHGVFVPMLLVRPQADIPIVQVSVLESEDPAAHFALGRALGRLRDENIAIIGSGFASFHNLRFMFSGAAGDPAFKGQLDAWNEAVTAAATVGNVSEREVRFRDWRKWPAAFAAHPRGGAEHFMPLLVCAGAAGDGVAKSYKDEFVGFDIYSYYWE